MTDSIRRSIRILVVAGLAFVSMTALAASADAAIILGGKTGTPGFVGYEDIYGGIVCHADYQSTRNPQYIRSFTYHGLYVTKAAGAALSQQVPLGQAYVQRWNGTSWVNVYISPWTKGYFDLAPLSSTIPTWTATWKIAGQTVYLSQGGYYRVWWDIHWMTDYVMIARQVLDFDRYTYTVDGTNVGGSVGSTSDGHGWCYLR